MIDKKQLGGRLKQLRKKNGLSIEKLAFATNLSVSFVGGLERGNKNCSIKTLEKITIRPPGVF